MTVAKGIVIVSLAGVGAAWVMAKDFWEEPFEKWKREEVLRMLSNSPWSQTQTFNAVAGGRGSGTAGEKEMFYQFTVRLFSARPIREAYVRMMQILNKYDQMPPEQKQEFNARFRKALSLDVSDRVIIALDYATNDPNATRDLRTFLETARTETLKQSVYLIAPRHGRLELREYYPPSPDGTGAKFIFPRLVNGQPVLGTQDKEIRFDFFIAPIGQRLFLTFKAPKLMYQGQLEY